MKGREIRRCILMMQAQSNLILLSVLHQDLKGVERLRKILDYLKPDVVTVEANERMKREYLMSERHQNLNRRIRSILKQRGLSEEELRKGYDPWIQEHTYSFEASTVRSYCKDKIPFYLIDLWDEQEMLTFEEIRIRGAESVDLDALRAAFDPETFQKNIEFQYMDISASFFGNSLIFSGPPASVPLDDPDVGRRDIYMESRLRKIIRENPEKRIVHVGGTKHSFDDPKHKRTLFSRIKDLNPERQLLNKAKYLIN